MKNQYFGDVNDLVKYGVLRCLVDEREIRGAICWMLTPNDSRTDGRHIAYPQQPRRYRQCDATLFDALRDAVGTERRDVAVAQEVELVPGAMYFDDVLGDGEAERTVYFSRLWDKVNGRELVFFDPDNGLEIESVPKGKRGSSRYLFLDELEATYGRGHSVLVYQHYPRLPRAEFIESVSARVVELVAVMPLFLRTPRVLFILIPQERDRSILAERADAAIARWEPLVLGPP